MTFIETNRLLLRNITPEDADIMYDYRNNEICARYQRGQTRDYEGILALTERRKNDKLSVEASFMVAGIYHFLAASQEGPGERTRYGAAENLYCSRV